jgi:alkanesulfonate monooxygenase SsuD/methylene tetrahydromethanopterin reductase-like flavin-dependent oxidoreductase (luciferase family)
LAARAEAVLELAILADVLGLDLVSFQDHPYQARFLDTWTLLSVVAARTANVHVAPNVTNLPLRPPAVLARSVASLDILSGGRVELGLGAGALLGRGGRDGRPSAHPWSERGRALRSGRRDSPLVVTGAGPGAV